MQLKMDVLFNHSLEICSSQTGQMKREVTKKTHLII